MLRGWPHERDGGLPDQFLMAHSQYVREEFLPWGLTQPPRQMAFGFQEFYDGFTVSLPRWLGIELGDPMQVTRPDYPSILPQLGDIIRELAPKFADLHLYYDTIVLMTDNRDWPDLIHGRQVARTIFHRLRFSHKENGWW